MIDFVCDPARQVADLADVSLDHTLHGRLVRQHLGHVELHRSMGWAMLLAAYRTWGEGGWGAPEYRIMRWRRLRGTWRIQDRFQLRPAHVEGLAALGPAFVAGVEAAVPPEERTREKVRGPIAEHRARRAARAASDGSGGEPLPVTQT